MKIERTGGEGFFRSCGRVLREPADFFSRPTTKRSRWRPVAFTTAVTALALPAGNLLTSLAEGHPGPAALGSTFLLLALSPLVAVSSLYITAGLTHFWLLVARAKPLPFSETRESVAYTSAANLVGVIPFVGPLLGIVWHTVILVISMRRTHGSSMGRVVFAVIAGLTTPVVLALGLRGGVIETFKMPSGSMLPTIQIGDHFFVNKMAYGPRLPLSDARFWERPARRGEVIVHRFPERRDQDYIKRVIALPGDRLEVKDGHPIINGWAVPSCPLGSYTYREGDSVVTRRAEMAVEYLEDKAYLTMYERTFSSGAGEPQGPYVVKPGEVWVLGDNRNNSHDSRSWFGGRGGGVPQVDLKGRAMFVWMSIDPKGKQSWGRLFVDVNGAPLLPDEQSALRPAFERCMNARPPLAKTTPPPPAAPG